MTGLTKHVSVVTLALVVVAVVLGGSAASSATSSAKDEVVVLYVIQRDGVFLAIRDDEKAAADPVAAVVHYARTLLTTGWDVLNVTTTATLADEDQAYAAGFGEGVATWESTWYNYQNQLYAPNQPPLPANISTWVHTNWKWMEAQVVARNATDPLWYHVGLTMLQFRGLLDGLNSAAPNASVAFTFDMLQSINLAGDLMDLYSIMNISTFSSTWRSMSKDAYMRAFATSTHCSALVKLKYDCSEIFFGHATWSTYNMMMRSYKTYTLNYASSAAKTVSLSGYAGVLASIDDFYVTSAGLAITETSFSILNATLYMYCNETQLFYWVRALVASRLASSAEEWVNLFAQYNSGTYNNQWIVLDTKRFTPFQDLVPGTLYIAEQVPGTVGIQDVTSTLQYGYWPSYNIPSIEALYVSSGNAEAVVTQGWEMNDYERCVRAQIFRRDQSKVVDIASMQFLMQYNDYETDPISQDNPTYAIAARGDLTQQQPMCWGAIDAKITSTKLMGSGGVVYAYSGPTPQQPPFDAATTNATIMCTPNAGQPVLWNFTFQRMSQQP